MNSRCRPARLDAPREGFSSQHLDGATLGDLKSGLPLPLQRQPLSIISSKVQENQQPAWASFGRGRPCAGKCELFCFWALESNMRVAGDILDILPTPFRTAHRQYQQIQSIHRHHHKQDPKQNDHQYRPWTRLWMMNIFARIRHWCDQWPCRQACCCLLPALHWYCAVLRVLILAGPVAALSSARPFTSNFFRPRHKGYSLLCNDSSLSLCANRIEILEVFVPYCWKSSGLFICLTCHHLTCRCSQHHAWPRGFSSTAKGHRCPPAGKL